MKAEDIIKTCIKGDTINVKLPPTITVSEVAKLLTKLDESRLLVNTGTWSTLSKMEQSQPLYGFLLVRFFVTKFENSQRKPRYGAVRLLFLSGSNFKSSLAKYRPMFVDDFVTLLTKKQKQIFALLEEKESEHISESSSYDSIFGTNSIKLKDVVEDQYKSLYYKSPEFIEDAESSSIGSLIPKINVSDYSAVITSAYSGWDKFTTTANSNDDVTTS